MSNRALLTTGAVLALWLGTPFQASAGYYLDEIIPLPDTNILNLSTDGTHLLVLANGHPDELQIRDTSGALLNSLPTGSAYTRAATWNGDKYVFAYGSTGASYFRLFEMDTTGTVTGPHKFLDYVPFGMGFDGQNLLLTDNLPIVHLVDSVSYLDVGTIVPSYPPGVTGALYGVQWHDDSLFLAPTNRPEVFRFDSTGTLLDTIPLNVGTTARGIAFVGDDLYVADRVASVIYRYAIPEPTAALMLALGGLIAVRRRR